MLKIPNYDIFSLNPNFFYFGRIICAANHGTLFSLKIHYAGFFSLAPARSYQNGDFAYVDRVDLDIFSIN